VTDLDLTAPIVRHRAEDAPASLALHEVPDLTRCGIVELADGRIVRFVEKPARRGRRQPGRRRPVRPGAADPAARPSGRSLGFGGDRFPNLLRRGLPCGHHLPGYVYDIGSPGRYAPTEADLRAGRLHPGPVPAAALAIPGAPRC
jgi:NDP-sugar pyrophosphorylase family protein